MNIIEFYFDLGSPYSYIGFHQIQKLAAQYQAEIIWKPMLLGGVFKATGNSSPITVPAKGQYSRLVLKRWSKFLDIPFNMNHDFPINTLQLMRVVTGLQLFQNEKFLMVVTALFKALYHEHQPIQNAAVLIQLLSQFDISAEQMEHWLADEKVKAELKLVTEEAIAKGVFGAPTCFVGGEMFWGVDHFNFVETVLGEQSHGHGK